MATTENFYTGNASTTSFGYSFPILQNSDLKVELDGVLKTENTSGTNNDYSISGTNVVFNSAPGSSVDIHIYRQTNVDSAKAVFAAGSSIRAGDLNNNVDQNLYANQEQQQKIKTSDVRNDAITTAKIKDGTIVNANINASAAIDGTKISPDFGSQNITTTGTVNGVSTTELSILDGATVTTSELNTLDGVTATKDEINILDGVTATKDEINILDGVTANKDELNILDGVTATTSELNTLDGVTASATEINILDGATISTTQLNNLQNIEPAAKDDQTAAEIKTLYEDSGNNNASYIKTTYESNAETNAFTDAEKTKLGNLGSLNALSDVDTSGVADNKILKYDASVSKFIIADDGGGGGSGGSSTFTGLSDTPANFGSSAGKVLKVNSGETALEFSDADVVADTSPQLGGNLDVQAREINTSTTNGNIKLAPNGTGVVEVKGNTNAGTLQLNCENNSHGVKIKSPAHSNNADYTVTLFNQDPSYLQHASFVKIDSSGQLSIDNNLYHVEPSHLDMGAFDITFAQTGGIFFDSDNSNNNKVGFFGATTIPNNVNFLLPGADGNAGTFLKTDGSGNLSFASAALVTETSPQLGGDLASNGHDIVFAQGDKAIFGSSNALQIYQSGNHVYIDEAGPGNLYIRNGTKNSIWCETNGKVKLYYNDSDKLETTDTGISVSGNVVLSNALLPSADSSSDIGTDANRWRDIYADNLHGDGSNLTGVNPTVANGCIYENSKEITTNFTTSTTKNSMSAGPITIANNVTLTIPNNSVYTIV